MSKRSKYSLKEKLNIIDDIEKADSLADLYLINTILMRILQGNGACL